MIQLSIPDKPDSVQELVFDGIDFKVRFIFFTRDQSWRMTFSDFEDNLILENIKIIPNWGITKGYHVAHAMPTGEFLCLKITEEDVPLGRDNFGEGKDYRLFYLTAEEVANGI